MSITKAGIGEQFSEVVISGDIPSNRAKFSCCKFDESHIIIIGGDGVGITTTEVWLFDTVACKFKQLETLQEPIKRRSGHSCCAYNNVCYIFGGTNGLEFCEELLIITVDAGLERFTYRTSESGSGPAARIGHTMTIMNKTVWMHGGSLENGELVSDLWELDFSLFPQSPSWHLVGDKRSPRPRQMHVSWRDNGFWIAGGIDPNGNPINEVWRYVNRWELMNVFDTENAVTGNDEQGLLEIGFRVTKVTMKPNFASLDGLFGRLILRQKEYSQSAMNDNATLQGMDEAHKTLMTSIRTLEKYTESNKSEDISAVTGFFSPKYRKMLAKQSETTRDKAVVIASCIANKFPEYINNDIPAQSAELAFQLSLKLQQSQKDFERMKQERQAEIDLQREHLAFLLNGRTTCSRLDPADFNTFAKTTQAFSKPQKEFALSQFYRMQLREYQMLMQQTAYVKDKFEKRQSGQEKRTGMISRLSDELTTRFKVVTAAEETLNKWKKQLKITQADVNKSQAFLDAMASFKTNQDGVMQRITALQKENEAVRQKIQQEANELSTNKRADVERLREKIRELEESIRGKAIDDSKAAVSNAFVRIKEIADRIVC